jgi:hypothetical protein
MRLCSKPILASLVVGVVLVAPLAAHEVETAPAKDVAATFHLDPNHQPKAGKPSRAWFALTRRGGHIIPLAQCACTLAVYAMPRRQSPPLLKPPLTAVNVEKYRGIPSANIIFPKAGRYTLELVGKAKAGGNFQPFKLSYEVTVGGYSKPK